MASKKHEHPAQSRACSKVEALVAEMQTPERGIPLRTNKQLLTSIAGVFQATDLVSWLMRRLGVEDRAEATTTAAVICKWGYIFPVENNNTPFKDDSTWMRFQSKYFWPSQNWDPDNTDYAIFLAKRLMRAKAKHALLDYEAESFEQLKHVLGGKWEQILEQAKAQLSQLRSYKRKDKQTFDSQERAFWRVHRPLPGSVKVTEISKMKLAVMIRELQRDRLFPQDKEQIEIAYYQSVLVRSSVRAQRQCESLIMYSQNYASYDSCFTAPIPGNPWVTDDTELWTQACVRIDCVGKQRAAKWSFNLSELLGDDTGQHAFSQFLEKEFSAENLNFWRECQEFKGLPASQIPAAADRIFKDFLALDSPSSINIDGPTLEAIKEATKKPTRYMFDAAETHIYELMGKGPYKRYLQSDEYKQLLQKNPAPLKKGFLGIPGMNFMRSTSPKPRRSPKSSPANTPPCTPPTERKRTKSSSGSCVDRDESHNDFVMQLVAGASSDRRGNVKSFPSGIPSSSTVPLDEVVDALTGQSLDGRSSPSVSMSSSSRGGTPGGHSPAVRGHSPAVCDSPLPPGVKLRDDGETV